MQCIKRNTLNEDESRNFETCGRIQRVTTPPAKVGNQLKPSVVQRKDNHRCETYIGSMQAVLLRLARTPIGGADIILKTIGHIEIFQPRVKVPSGFKNKECTPLRIIQEPRRFRCLCIRLGEQEGTMDIKTLGLYLCFARSYKERTDR